MKWRRNHSFEHDAKPDKEEKKNEVNPKNLLQ
jgi:hypothetical protein